jgi:hypothetical protein
MGFFWIAGRLDQFPSLAAILEKARTEIAAWLSATTLTASLNGSQFP